MHRSVDLQSQTLYDFDCYSPNRFDFEKWKVQLFTSENVNYSLPVWLKYDGLELFSWEIGCLELPTFGNAFWLMFILAELQLRCTLPWSWKAHANAQRFVRYSKLTKFQIHLKLCLNSVKDDCSNWDLPTFTPYIQWPIQIWNMAEDIITPKVISCCCSFLLAGFLMFFSLLIKSFAKQGSV